MTLSAESALRKDRTNAKSTLEHRHFAFIAATLLAMRPEVDNPAKLDPGEANAAWYETWRQQVDHWADACAATNPRFDRARFLRACGVAS